MWSFLSLAALAADLPTVAVVGLHRAELDLDAQLAANEAIAARVDATGQFDALGHVEIVQRIDGLEDVIVEDAVLSPGRRLLDDGRALWSQAQPEEALPLLDDAIASLRAAMAAGVPSSDLWDAYMVRGLALRDLGDDEGTKATWEAAIAAAPTRNPDPAVYPPDAVAAFDRIRGDMMLEAATVEIDASAAGARVLLDGVERGTTPLSLSDVVPGTHIIVVVAADGTRGSATLEADAATPATVRVSLGPPTLGESPTTSFGKARQVGAVYRALAGRAQVDLVLIAGVIDNELRLQLYSTKANAFSQPVAVPFEGDPSDEAAVAVTQVLATLEDGALPVGKTVANAIPVDPSANALLARLLLASDTLPGPAVDEPRPKWVVPVIVGAGVVLAGGIAGGVAASGGDKGTITVTLP